METKKELRFYEQPLFTWFLLVVLPPIGLFFLWLNKHYTLFTRILISVLFILLFLNLLGLHEGLIRALLFSIALTGLEYMRQKIHQVMEQSKKHYKSLKADEVINTIFQNFLSLYHKDIDTLKSMVGMEYYLEEEYPLFHRIYSLHVSDYYQIKAVYKSIYKTIKEEDKIEKLRTYFDEKFIPLVRLLSEGTEFCSERHAYYITWMLLKEKLMEYNGKDFSKKYNHYFNHCMKLEDYVKVFIRLDNMDYENEDSKDILFFTYYLIQKGVFKEDYKFLDCLYDVCDEIEDEIEIKEQDDFVLSLHQKDIMIYDKLITIDYVDHVKDGETFEYLVAFLFKKKGYDAEVTKNPDFGVDVILKSSEVRFGIQTKWYHGRKVSLDAVQEIKTGLKKYKLTSGFVVTNSTYTKPAIDLAIDNNIILWDRDTLKEELKKAKLKVKDFQVYLKENKK